MRHVAIFAFPGAQLLDIAGPGDVFSEANRQTGETHYHLEVVGMAAGPVATSSGLTIQATRGIADPIIPVDTLLITGEPDLYAKEIPEEVVAWIRASSDGARRYGSVCGGAFALAASGLLDGRAATTHWMHGERFAQRFPAVQLDTNRIFTTDGPVWTSAGVTTGIDLALAMVEEDMGRDLALAVARKLVVFLKRPGGQSQFSAHLAAQTSQKTPIQAVQAYVLENLAGDLAVPILAKRAGMSERHFARIFRSETGKTPAEFVEIARLDAARRLVEDVSQPMQRIASRTGFGDMVTMRRAFLRQLAVSPLAYRKSFARSA